MWVSQEHIGPLILKEIQMYILTRAELLFTLCYETPCIMQILTHNVDVGLDECSRHERISVLYAYLESFIAKTYTVLVAIFSWAIRTFSEPLIIK
jgi:hypothetical protein